MSVQHHAWRSLNDCPDGDVWFALSCGHVVMGYKAGEFMEWESMADHDCCFDAHAISAMPVQVPQHPQCQAGGAA